MNNATHFILQQQSRKFEGDLSHWVSRVRAARQDLDAVRIATQAPIPGPLIRGLRSQWSGQLLRAQQAVEREVFKRVEALDIEAPEFTAILRMSQGHLPAVYRHLDERMRSGGSRMSPDPSGPAMDDGPR